MTPDDVSTVQRSWAELRRHQAALIAELRQRYGDASAGSLLPDLRAAWLFLAVDELVGLLEAPSRLADRAYDLGDSWPEPLTAPCFAIDGRAWMSAAAACMPHWTPAVESAWRQAWLLLSDVLAAETLSPFADGWHMDDAR
jgi:hypothetical protein